MKLKNKHIKLLLFLGLAAIAPVKGMEPDQLTQTMQHLVNNPKAVDVAQKFVAKNDRMLVASNFLAKETALHDDYYTFVHGHNAGYYFPLKIYTLLWQLYKKREIKDFIFPQVRPLTEKESDIVDEENARVYLLKYGEDCGYYYKDLLLSMNYAFFANATHRGSSSSWRVARGAGLKGIYPLRTSFKIFNHESTYTKFKTEIIALATEYNQKSLSGNALCIAVPRNKINECVFPVQVGGHKISLYIKGVGYTSDMKIILETLRNNPEKIKSTDVIEFCLILTQRNGGMDPDTGIKIFPILSGDPEKIDELRKKEDALFAKIKADIEEHEKQQNKPLSRAAVLANQVVQSAQASAVVPTQAMGRMHNIVNHLTAK